MIEHGLNTLLSRRSVGDTIDVLAEAVAARGLTIFARVDHAKNAVSVGLHLRPTQLLIFGNPIAGTPLMQENQMAGIDLPMKALAWEDANGEVWLTWADASWLAERYGLDRGVEDTIKAIEGVMASLVRAASGT